MEEISTVLLKASLETFSATQNLWRRVRVPLWGAGGLVGDNEDCTGFLYMPRRPFYWHINKHGVHTFDNKQLGL